MNDNREKMREELIKIIVARAREYHAIIPVVCRKMIADDILDRKADLTKLKDLIKELFDILDVEEESETGRSFRPTNIETCRVLHSIKLKEILPKIRKSLMLLERK